MNPARFQSTVVAVLAEAILGRLAFGIASFALPLYALALGLSFAQIGFVIGLRTLVVVALKPLAGRLSDRVGLRQMYLGAGVLRVVAAGALVLAGDFMGLLLARLLQGASAAGRDVGSLGLIVRDADTRVASVFSWYMTAKHVGGVAGAALAGVLLLATDGSHRTVFLVVGLLSLVALAASWRALPDDEARDERRGVTRVEGMAVGAPDPWTEHAPSGPAAAVPTRSQSFRAIAGVGFMVAAAASMVHGLFPILATQHAGLTEFEAGLVYSLSAAVVLVAGPLFGWLIDRHGRLIGLAWRSFANVGSSVLYLVAPSFGGFGLARALDDSGKVAFRPAWASIAAAFASEDRERAGRRLGTLDSAQSAGEAAGPLLAGLLWQTGGVVALFGVRIVLAVAAELAALRVFGELHRVPFMGLGPKLTAIAYLTPPMLAGLATTAGLVAIDTLRGGLSWSDVLWSAGVLCAGVLGGYLAGARAADAERRALLAILDDRLTDVRHDVRSPLTCVRGEVELVLSRDSLSPAERAAASGRLLRSVDDVETIVRRIDTSPVLVDEGRR